MARSFYWRLLDALVTVTDATYAEAQHALVVVQEFWDDRAWRLSVQGHDGVRRHPRVAQAAVDAWRDREKKKRWVVEITLRTRGGTYKRKETVYDARGRKQAVRVHRVRDRRPLFLKIRLIHHVPTPLTLPEYVRMFRRITETGVLPDRVALEIIDWEKGRGARVNRGRITRNMAVALQDFYGAAHFPGTVIEAAFVAED